MKHLANHMRAAVALHLAVLPTTLRRTAILLMAVGLAANAGQAERKGLNRPDRADQPQIQRVMPEHEIPLAHPRINHERAASDPKLRGPHSSNRHSGEVRSPEFKTIEHALEHYMRPGSHGEYSWAHATMLYHAGHGFSSDVNDPRFRVEALSLPSQTLHSGNSIQVAEVEFHGHGYT